MKLRAALNSFIVEDLKQLVRLCGGPGPDGARKEQLVEYIVDRITHPVVLAEMWQRLDPLSRKAVASAYHAGGEFAPEAFVTQYGELPGQMAGLSLPSMVYVFHRELSPVELFIYGGEIPEEIMELLGPLVPPPEKFAHVEDVTPASELSARLQRKVRLPQVLLDKSSLQRGRVGSRLLLEDRKSAARVEQGDVVMYLRHVDVAVEAMGVTRLVVAGRSTHPALGEDLLHPVKVPVEPVYPLVLHLEPGPTVDPWSPLAECRHRTGRMAIVQLLGQPAKLRNRGRVSGPIVDPKVHI